MIIAGQANEAMAARADGFHRRSQHRGPRHLLRTVAVHDTKELRLAERVGADLLFISPVFPTRSHPGARALGRTGLFALARLTRIPAIALGGMTASRARGVMTHRIHGWAAIGALTPVAD